MNWGTRSSQDWQAQDQNALYQQRPGWHDVWDFSLKKQSWGSSSWSSPSWNTWTEHQEEAEGLRHNFSTSGTNGGGKCDNSKGKSKHPQAFGKGASSGEGGYAYYKGASSGKGGYRYDVNAKEFNVKQNDYPEEPVGAEMSGTQDVGSIRKSTEAEDSKLRQESQKNNVETHGTKRFELQTQNWIIEEEAPKDVPPGVTGGCAVFSIADDDEVEDDSLADWYSGYQGALRRSSGKIPEKELADKETQKVKDAARNSRKSLQAQMLAKIRQGNK
eukprot:gnl/MRDRNA2_/MRDRNA2_66067_c0_seq1.p1 gnl/MRDRNA2_/MRDRNA2_66067_c0~~gnl/MRDRNA2_/MRDRNA2_66067_c0_seq1.p1  ORF type:complete len:273 (-),score=71.95 gnl/MRDRNA2_/MRDRNA2_66067_c0_seq1:155-973(-)